MGVGLRPLPVSTIENKGKNRGEVKEMWLMSRRLARAARLKEVNVAIRR